MYVFLVSSCGGAIPFVGEGSDSVLTASDQSYSLRLAPQWSVAGKGVKSGDMGRDAVYVLAHPDGARSDQGYPTMVVREVRDKAPVGLFELMAKDKGLEYSELWSVGKDKYQLRQAQVDDKGKLLTYWLVPAGGQGVEYFGAMYLTSWGRLELIGLAQAGTAQKYAKDFGAMIASVRLEGKTDPEGGKSGDLGRYLIRTYRQSIERERQALARLSSDIAAQAAGGAGMDGPAKGHAPDLVRQGGGRLPGGCCRSGVAVVSGRRRGERGETLGLAGPGGAVGRCGHSYRDHRAQPARPDCKDHGGKGRRAGQKAGRSRPRGACAAVVEVRHGSTVRAKGAWQAIWGCRRKPAQDPLSGLRASGLGG